MRTGRRYSKAIDGPKNAAAASPSSRAEVRRNDPDGHGGSLARWQGMRRLRIYHRGTDSEVKPVIERTHNFAVQGSQRPGETTMCTDVHGGSGPFAHTEAVTGSSSVAPTTPALTSRNAGQFAVWGPVRRAMYRMKSVSILQLAVHGPARPRPAPPLLRAAPVRREPLNPHRHHLLSSPSGRPTPSSAIGGPAWRPLPRPTSRRSWPTCSLGGWPAPPPPTTRSSRSSTVGWRRKRRSQSTRWPSESTVG
jgi:hypothetical protein